MTERLDWIEKAGIENMKVHHTCADTLAKEAATTLALLLVGMGGGMAYAAKAIDAHSWNWFAVGAAAFTIWLLALSWYLVTKCLMVEPIPQIYNEPKNLNDPPEDFDHMRECELLSLQKRIDDSAARNGRLASRLNLARRLAIASPAIFFIFSVAWLVIVRVFEVS